MLIIRDGTWFWFHSCKLHNLRCVILLSLPLVDKSLDELNGVNVT